MIDSKPSSNRPKPIGSPGVENMGGERVALEPIGGEHKP